MTIIIIMCALSLILGYIIGSLPSAYIMGRLRKRGDIRQVGSRNMGAMNVFYQIGFAEGVIVLSTDIAKGAAAVALARYLGTPEWLQLLAGLAALAGHIFPVFLKFRGGRGGATCIGILVFLMPWGIPFYLALFGISLLVSRYPTFSYSLAFLCFPFVAGFIYHSWVLATYSAILILILLTGYLPRIKEMRAKGGSWAHVALRKDLKDRF